MTSSFPLHLPALFEDNMPDVITNTRIRIVDPDQLPPFPHGLYQHVEWTSDDPHILIESGVVFRPQNFGGESAFGIITANWCPNDSDDPMTGTRPDLTGYADDPFTEQTVYAFDQTQCGDLSAMSLEEVRDRVLRNFERLEPLAAEKALAGRMLSDAPSPAAATDLLDAIGQLEDAIAAVGIGDALIHARPYWASLAASTRILQPDFTTVLGNRWVFGGGYAGDDGLVDTLIATSPVYGWRTEIPQHEIIEYESNQMTSLMQRSVLLGYEKVIAAVTIS